MEIVFDKKFLKDLAKIPAKIRIKIEVLVFNQLQEFNNIYEIQKAEKLKGYDNYYKIRFGDYRIGIYYEKGRIVLKRVMNRKEIYKYFPKTN